ncbi:MAG: bifunctional helix-turn-helix transcriptional regulator/GNAT family N-acetyltransferase [Desulfobacterales bacterium]|nr:bifunctional helix-turn-helix transcriptional regulator/GNAT family N-acetyltransferase [Desulfobacterales bacterium]
MQSEIQVIRKASREIVREFGLLESDCAKTGVSYAEGHALLEIDKYDILTAGQMSVILNLNRSSTARTLQKLKKKGWVQDVPDPDDCKKKPVKLTKSGRKKVEEINQYSDSRVAKALFFLDKDQVNTAFAGMRDYAKALKLSRVEEQFQIRPIQKKDNPAIRKIIEKVSAEFSTCGEGGPTADKELYDMYSAYSKPKSIYFVVLDQNKVLGGAGIGPLKASEKGLCEFQKMYFVPQARGRGLGEILMRKCIAAASEFGYKKMYIETIDRMVQAVNLYIKLGARKVNEPLGNTGHHQCERMMVIDL